MDSYAIGTICFLVGLFAGIGIDLYEKRISKDKQQHDNGHN